MAGCWRIGPVFVLKLDRPPGVPGLAVGDWALALRSVDPGIGNVVLVCLGGLPFLRRVAARRGRQVWLAGETAYGQVPLQSVAARVVFVLRRGPLRLLRVSQLPLPPLRIGPAMQARSGLPCE